MKDSGKNKAAIGAFVLGAVALAVIGVILFGGGQFFSETNRFVLLFDGSVKGLNIGAPVTFRGVKIGSVVDIAVRTNPTDWTTRIPVVIELEEGKVEREVERTGSVEENLKRLIDAGLRAKLDLQSMVTGNLLVDLEFLPEEPTRLSGYPHQYPEMPTVPSNFERIAKKIEALPIDEIVNKVSASLTALEAFLTNHALTESLNHLSQATANAEELTANLDRQMGPLVASMQGIADHADQLILNVNDQIQPLAGEARRTLKNTNAAAESIRQAANAFAELSTGAQPAIVQAGQAFANVADMTDPNAKERYELRNMLKELSEAARSIRVWSSYLERHPEALITGKGGSKRR